jgi:hypothetical protein
VLYLLEPALTVLYNGDPGSGEILEHARGNPHVDLADLQWDLVPRPVNRELLLKVALLHGAPCSRGIVMDGALVGILDRCYPHSRDYRKTSPGHGRSPAHQQAVDQWLGTPADVVLQRQAIAKRIATQHADDQTKAEAQAARLLAGTPSQELLRHWVALGGSEPA